MSKTVMPDVRLQPWLDLASEFEALIRFMAEAELSHDGALIRSGEIAVAKARAISAVRWCRIVCKRNDMRDVIQSEIFVLHRFIDEGSFQRCDDTAVLDELMERLAMLSTTISRLDGVVGRRVESSGLERWWSRW